MWFCKKKVMCVDCGYLGMFHSQSEVQPKIREKICKIQKGHFGHKLSCYRKLIEDVEEAGIILADRECKFFFDYEPGCSPAEHKELKRERETRRILLIGMLAAAVIGAAAAIVAQLIARL